MTLERYEPMDPERAAKFLEPMEDVVEMSWRMGWTVPPIPVTAQEEQAWLEREGE